VRPSSFACALIRGSNFLFTLICEVTRFFLDFFLYGRTASRCSFLAAFICDLKLICFVDILFLHFFFLHIYSWERNRERSMYPGIHAIFNQSGSPIPESLSDKISMFSYRLLCMWSPPRQFAVIFGGWQLHTNRFISQFFIEDSLITSCLKLLGSMTLMRPDESVHQAASGTSNKNPLYAKGRSPTSNWQPVHSAQRTYLLVGFTADKNQRTTCEMWFAEKQKATTAFHNYVKYDGSLS
jgi:hypothetical protein